MKNLLKSLIVVIIVSLNSYSNLNAKETSPIKISVKSEWNNVYRYYYYKLIITSISDSVSVKNVSVNREGCKVYKKDIVMRNGMLRETSIFPKKLNFGRSMEVRVGRDCDLLEVEVDTTKGKWAYSFE